MAKRTRVFRPPGSVGSKAERDRIYNRYTRDREAQQFYQSRPWRELRAIKLRQDPLCEKCKAEGRLTPAKHVHHRKERRTHPELELDLANTESLCIPCHNSHKRRD